MSDPVGSAMKFLAGCAIVAGGVVATGIYVGVQHHEESKTVDTLKARAEDSLRTQSLTPITLERFNKASYCSDDRPYGATFVAENKDGKVVRGTVCSAPNRENIVKLNP